MIPVKKDEVEVISTMGGREIPMTIDEASLQHVMGVLRNMYSDVELAVIRELSTNAYDSHIAAGQVRPIKVSTPSAYSPYFKVQDFGVGMDESDIERIYSRYGVSTKRESNEFTGYLGIGSKAPLAYSNQFSVTAAKAGKRILVTVGLDEEGVGTMTVNGPYDTTEPNGVEIAVPAKPGDQFLSKCQDFFMYWPAGSVLLNGKPPEGRAGEIKITSTISMYPARDHYTPHHKLVMGVVPYPIDNSKITLPVNRGFDIVAHEPLGTVHLTPNREALNYTRITMKVLTELQSTLETEIRAALQREVDVQPSKPLALKKSVELSKQMYQRRGFGRGPKPFTYKGVDIPRAFRGTFIVTRAEPETSWYADNRHRNVGKHHVEAELDAGHVTGSVFITHFSQTTFTHITKKKLWEWFKQHNRELPKHFVLVRGALPPELSPWVPAANVLQWPPISLIKLAQPKRDKGTAGKYVTKYDVFVDGPKGLQYNMPASDIDTKNPIFYVVGRVYDGDHWARRLSQFYDHFTVVVLQTQRLKKFLRLFPMAQRPANALNQAWEDWWNFLSADEKLLMQIYRRDYQMEFTSIPLTGIEDPEVSRIVKLVRSKRIRPEVVAAKEAFGPHRVPDMEDPLKDYPLVGEARGSSRGMIKEHNRMYINAVYEHNLRKRLVESLAEAQSTKEGAEAVA